MKGGDISNEVPPRFVIVWDALASLQDEDLKGHAKAVKKERYDQAARYWTIDRTMAGRMLLAENRLGIRWEMAAFGLNKEYCFAIEERLDAENIGVAQVSPFLSPIALKDYLAYRPDVKAVIDIPSRGLYYGGLTLDPRSI